MSTGCRLIAFEQRTSPSAMLALWMHFAAFKHTQVNESASTPNNRNLRWCSTTALSIESQQGMMLQTMRNTSSFNDLDNLLELLRAQFIFVVIKIPFSSETETWTTKAANRFVQI